ncbi:unnamed protein product, partial [Ectocarpus sp. 12 AP-2014]
MMPPSGRGVKNSTTVSPTAADSSAAGGNAVGLATEEANKPAPPPVAQATATRRQLSNRRGGPENVTAAGDTQPGARFVGPGGTFPWRSDDDGGDGGRSVGGVRVFNSGKSSGDTRASKAALLA